MKDILVAVAAQSYDRNTERLTPQERRILERMLRADSSKETARKLGLAVSTTKNLRSRVLQKMMADSTPTLVRIAAYAGVRRASDDGN